MKLVFGLIGLLGCGSAVALASLGSPADDSALLKAVANSKHTLAEGIKQVSKAPETALSAKFELDDNGKLSLSVYTAEKGLGVDAEHNVLKEYGGSPEQLAWKPGIEVFEDVAHVARSAQQQTLMALTRTSLLDVLARAEKEAKGQVLSITPVLEGHHASFVLQLVSGGKVIAAKYGLFGDEDDDEHADDDDDDDDDGQGGG